MVRLLSIDSSSPSGGVALLEGGRIVSQTPLPKTPSYSNCLLSLVDKTLSDSHYALSDMDGFCLTTGPGSFTGLRVGVSLVKGFILATHKPYVEVNALEALAALAQPTSRQICPVLDARKREVYAAFFKYQGGQLRRESPDFVVSPQALAERVTQPAVFIGPGLEIYGSYLSQTLGPLFSQEAKPRNDTAAAGAALIASVQFEVHKSSDLNLLNIHYVRKSEAEINFAG